MEINTCERYVLAKLEEAQRENEALRGEVQELLDKLAGATKAPDYLSKRIADIGRKLVFEEWFYTATSSDAQAFEDFCHDIAAYRRPDDISEKAAIRIFEPELRELWEYTQAKREAEKEDAE